ncbi:hypothetical protein QR680_010488 [Steinernema hermaphroditum]|uniref:Uncharacterized protein n=1 Tax=Steinernema hermaphroditum TaxID=289476 RepID=A0AA39MBP1_9BILA|nr:hypothetical protein QR680_010488 [Steinernema hermaphroditum]
MPAKAFEINLQNNIITPIQSVPNGPILALGFDDQLYCDCENCSRSRTKRPLKTAQKMVSYSTPIKVPHCVAALLRTTTDLKKGSKKIKTLWDVLQWITFSLNTCPLSDTERQREHRRRIGELETHGEAAQRIEHECCRKRHARQRASQEQAGSSQQRDTHRRKDAHVEESPLPTHLDGRTDSSADLSSMVAHQPDFLAKIDEAKSAMRAISSANRRFRKTCSRAAVKSFGLMFNTVDGLLKVHDDDEQRQTVINRREVLPEARLFHWLRRIEYPFNPLVDRFSCAAESSMNLRQPRDQCCSTSHRLQGFFNFAYQQIRTFFLRLMFFIPYFNYRVALSSNINCRSTAPSVFMPHRFTSWCLDDCTSYHGGEELDLNEHVRQGSSLEIVFVSRQIGYSMPVKTFETWKRILLRQSSQFQMDPFAPPKATNTSTMIEMTLRTLDDFD